MASDFRRQCYLRIACLLATLCLLTYLLVVQNLVVTSVSLAVVTAIQVVGLIRFVETSNRDLVRFLSAIKLADFSQSFTHRIEGSDFPALAESLNEVVASFRNITREREEQTAYLQAVIKHVGIGMIAFTDEGDVRLFNHALGRMLNLSGVNHLNGIAPVCRELVDPLKQIRAGGSEVVSVAIQGEMMQLSLRATGLRLRGEQLTLVTLQNISLELNEKEMEAWQTLVRVLTHELGNSLTPIASLTASVEQLLQDSDEDVRRALATIRKRSEGLQRFVDSYRDLTNIPKPKFATFAIKDVFQQLALLMGPRLVAQGIELSHRVSPDHQRLHADPKLIEQVLINLILNAIAAVAEVHKPTIRMEAYSDSRGRQVISVSDNGVGIVMEAREKIFIPFYTTRKEGSGIGLSLSRQIMRLHRGELTVDDHPELTTRFYLRF